MANNRLVKLSDIGYEDFHASLPYHSFKKNSALWKQTASRGSSKLTCALPEAVPAHKKDHTLALSFVAPRITFPFTLGDTFIPVGHAYDLRVRA